MPHVGHSLRWVRQKGHMWLNRKPLGERDRVPGCVGVDVVVEVDVDVLGGGGQFADLLGPGVECGVAVVAGVELLVAMQTDVGEVDRRSACRIEHRYSDVFEVWE